MSRLIENSVSPKLVSLYRQVNPVHSPVGEVYKRFRPAFKSTGGKYYLAPKFLPFLPPDGTYTRQVVAVFALREHRDICW
jgi:hypothetical protein